MSFQEVSVNMIIGLITGLISGCVSGYFISDYFKNKDGELQWKRDLTDDKQNMSSYINLVCWEFEQLMSGDGRETKDLQKLLISPPRFQSFDREKINPEHHDFTQVAYSLFEEIYNYIKYDIPEEVFDTQKTKYIQYRSDLRLSHFL